MSTVRNEVMISSVRLAKINWQCRRGMLELDLLCLKFVKYHIHSLTEVQLQAFEQLLEQSDPLLLSYLMGHETVHEKELVEIVAFIRSVL
ncbi:MAG: succinate dehydrogenase assembly factor 2 [Legionellales bacterium]|nr:succinate dehydrogenase assembly factor 2 [Legionellales bacterium]